MHKALRWLKNHRVAVLKGGWSAERSISLKTGAAVEASLKRLGIRATSVDVQRNIFEVLRKKRFQFCVIALHGEFGEDGRLQGALDALKIFYTGSPALASAIAMDKNISKKIFREAGVPTAPWALVSRDTSTNVAAVEKLLRRGPVFVKPVDQGSAIGVSRVARKSELPKALRKCFHVADTVMVEKFIDGRELTVGILGDETLPVVRIVPQHEFYDFHSKYAPGGSRHIVPADISTVAARRAQQIALHAFRSLGCSVYGRVDVMMKSEREMYVLEVNTIPGMTSTSLLPDAANAVGINFDSLVMKILELSLRKHGAI